MKVRFSVDGKSVGPEALSDALVEQAATAGRNEVELRVAGLRCPSHGEAPRLVTEGISCCCSALEAVVRSAFA